jgi:clan AA aspartic protease (TIGR02281 family)
MAPSARTKQCPACWSTIDIEEIQCPQCDVMLQQQRRGRSFIIVLVVTLAVGTAVWGWIQRPGASDPRTQRTAEDTRDPAEIEPERHQQNARVATRSETAGKPGQSADIRVSPLWTVYAEMTKRPVFLIALAHKETRTGRIHYCLPAAFLPTNQGLVDSEGRPLEFTAITWERRSGLVMLAGAPPAPIWNGFVPQTVRDHRTIAKGEALVAITTNGSRRELHLTQAGFPMVFDAPLAPGSVVVDASDRVVAYGTKQGGQPVHVLTPWREWWTGQTLLELQKEIRAADPELILLDARRLLDSASVTIETTERAVESLTRGQHLARDRVTIEAFDRTLRFGHLQRVRLLSAINGVRALQQARASLSLLGSDPDILSDATELAMDHGDPRDALAFYQSLLATSADHAAKIRDRIGRKLKAKADRMLSEKRNQETAQLLGEAVRSFPQRADLRMVYARALSKLGDRVAAGFQADEAARLDKSYVTQARQFTGATRKGRRVAIPFNKNAGTIYTTCSVSGRDLSFVVDTGASYTVIPSATAKALGLIKRDSPTVDVTTANGVIQARQVVIPTLTIAGKITLQKVGAVVLDLPGNHHGKGLLGLNVLRPLNMQIDDRRSLLILRQPSRRK